MSVKREEGGEESNLYAIREAAGLIMKVVHFVFEGWTNMTSSS